MQRTSAELTEQVDLKWEDNSSGNITGQDANDVAIDFTDSFMPKADYSYASVYGVLTYNQTGVYSIAHNFGSENLDSAIYNTFGQLLDDEFYFLNPVDGNTCEIVFYAPLNPLDSFAYLLINLSM